MFAGVFLSLEVATLLVLLLEVDEGVERSGVTEVLLLVVVVVLPVLVLEELVGRLGVVELVLGVVVFL